MLVVLSGALCVLPAPAGAEQGFGAGTPGGSGRPIVRVTNLNDSGPGSLRDALSSGNRTIVFDVGGQIVLASDLTLRAANVTIDGLTAPFPGITLMNFGLILRGPGAHDVIVRGIRIRNAARDGIWVTDAAFNILIEHVSIHNSFDGNLDITRTGTRDITVAWSIIAEPAGEEKNMLLAFLQSRVTLHHNLFVASAQRNPQVTYDDGLGRTQDQDTTLDMRNNLVWNWRGGYGTRIRYGARANVVNNYYDPAGGDASDALVVCRGSASDSDCDSDPTNVARAYVKGNVGASDAEGTETQPFPAPLVNAETPLAAACRVWAQAGVRPLDDIDAFYVGQIVLNCPLGQPPVAAAGPDQAVVLGAPVVLSGVGSWDPDGDALQHSWNLGDGTQLTGAVVSHAYSAAGVYTVTLTVTAGGETAIDTAVVTVAGSSGGGGSSSYTQRVNSGGGVYTDTGGNLWSADRAYTPGSWGYAGGASYGTNDPIANTTDDPLYRSVRYGNFGYRFAVPAGRYDVILHFAEIYHQAPAQRLFDVFIEGALVLDNYDTYAVAGHDGAVAVSFSNVLVTDGQLNLDFISVRDHAKVAAISVRSSGTAAPPTADAGPDQTVALGDPVTLDGSASSDPNGGSLTYSWDLGDGATGSGPTLTHTYAAPGIYTVTLTVSDGVLSGSATAEVTVTSVSPTGYTQRVNAGGGGYAAGGGNLWSADRAYSPGSWGYVGGAPYGTNDPIANTTDDPLYRSVRYGTFSYRFDVPNGLYDVILHFSEIYHRAPGQRRFDVFIEGALVLDNYDTYGVVGHDVAVSRVFPDILVSDGQLRIDFVSVQDWAIVSAISVSTSPP